MKFFKTELSTPVSGLSLAVFRILFGAIMLWVVLYYLVSAPEALSEGFVQPEFHPTYPFFHWVSAWPNLWMAQAHFAVMGIFALMIAIGLFYRFAIVAFTLMFAYFFLIDQTLYLNHYYLVIVVGILMCFLPADRALSLDSWRHKWSESVPVWCVWAMRLQIETVLLYAGFVKIKHDWLHLQPLGIFFSNKAAAAHSELFMMLTGQAWFVALGVYGVIVLHLVGAPLLLVRKTRIWVFLVYCMFHLTNAYLFPIGIFPFFTIAATLIFFDPQWPRLVLARLRQWLPALPLPRFEAPVGAALAQERQNALLPVVIVWLVFQALLPMRVYLFPGDSGWTSEGSTFSWRMMLDRKASYDFSCKITDDARKQQWIVKPRDFLFPWQYDKTAISPALILQFAHYLEDVWKKRGQHDDVAVYCGAYVSMNGREPQMIIDPAVDLTKEKWDMFGHEKWILPLTKPLPAWGERTW